MNKIVLILADALRYDVARDNMEFLGHLVETKQASLYKMIGELPSMSRPMYEMVRYLAPLLLEWKEPGYTILVTGDHGINKDGSYGGRTP
jgi:hypothetical protein